MTSVYISNITDYGTVSGQILVSHLEPLKNKTCQIFAKRHTSSHQSKCTAHIDTMDGVAHRDKHISGPSLCGFKDADWMLKTHINLRRGRNKPVLIIPLAAVCFPQCCPQMLKIVHIYGAYQICCELYQVIIRERQFIFCGNVILLLHSTGIFRNCV